MKKTKEMCKIFKVLSFMLFLLMSAQVAAQTRVFTKEHSAALVLKNDVDQVDYLSAKGLTPYLDILVGLSTFKSYRYNSVGIALDVRGGLVTKQSLIFGTGISIAELANYELGIMLPLEIGYRLPNQQWDFTYGIGYLFLQSWGDRDIHPDDLKGRTLSLDAHWRPPLMWKGLKFTAAAGGLMYNLGGSRILTNFCDSCNQKTGPRYSFRLRLGLSF